MDRMTWLLGGAMAALLSLGGARDDVRTLADWENGVPETWESQVFDGVTRYVVREGDRGASIEAIAEDSASCLYREVEIDVTRTPHLRWSWRVDELPDLDESERTKAGDDYAARIYVVREGWFGPLTAKAIDYVWSTREPVGTRWPNAFASSAIMWAVDQGEARLGEWVQHTRNVREDWKVAFGEDLDRLDGIAIMTDADNSDSRARARFGSIRFCETASCGDSE